MDGIVIINKPKHQTSHDIVRKAKKILNEKVGHTGTLDPNATGVLPLLIGKGTELSKYLINHDKTYEAILQLGEKRDTGDVEGKIIEQKNVTEKSLNTENINSVFKTLIGKQEQIPPIYSALKVNGKKLYEYARKGVEVEIPKREIEIYNIELMLPEERNAYLKKTLNEEEYKVYEIYLASNKFNMEDFIDYLNKLIELNDPTVVVLVPNDKVNYDYIDKNIKTKVSDGIYKGIKILYRNKVYDFSLNEGNV